MKKSVLCFVAAMLLLYGACAAESDKGNSSLLTEVAQQTDLTEFSEQPAATESPVEPTKQPEPAEPQVEAEAWTELTCYADLKTSLRNSNLLNDGYLTYDEEGNIYFVDKNKGGIFVSGQNGENIRQICEQTAEALQIEGEWLYCKVQGVLMRIHIHSGEEQVVYEGPHGAVMLTGERIYLDAPEGFLSLNLDGADKLILREGAPTLTSYVAGEKFWLGVAYDDINVKYFMEGHLYAFDEGRDTVLHIEDGCWYPVLAGNWLSVFGPNTGTRYVWNLETDEKTDLKAYAQRVVCNGEELFYIDIGSENATVYCWDGSETKEIWSVEGVSYCENLFLTPEALYIMPKVTVDKKTVTQLWYYELETGKTGQVY